jgi:ParB family chromosome partitioning protein
MSNSLGKGLAAILGEGNIGPEQGYIPDLDINLILPNPKQPRQSIDTEELVGLADSIREHGILEPLLVTRIPEEERSDLLRLSQMAEYFLVAGERRWRAAGLAQMQTVPVIIKEVSGRELLEMAVIENIQRKDLNPIEEALAFAELYNNYRVKLEDLSKKLGLSESSISNKMRLLKLPKPVQDGVLEGKISESHAYLVLSLKSKDAMLAVYNQIIKRGLSVRETDEAVRRIAMLNKALEPRKSMGGRSVIYDEKTVEISEKLAEKFGEGFKLRRTKRGGQIVIPFKSDEQLEKLYKYLADKDFLV